MIERLFLSVGAMKAGTTWLHRQLASHPDIHFCPEKEIHYFADPQAKSWMSLDTRLARYQRVVSNLRSARLNPHVQRNLAWYAKNWLAPDVSDGWYEHLFDMRPPRKAKARYMADFSNLYAMLDAEGWSHVKQVARDIRVVYTLRHPSERLWSQFKFSYEFAGRAGELAQIGAAEIDAFFAEAGTQAIADYAGSIERLKTHLPQDHIKVCFFEAFRSAPLENLRSIEGFLGLDAQNYREESLQGRINPSQDRVVPNRFVTLAEAVRHDQMARLAAMGFALPDEWEIPLG